MGLLRGSVFCAISALLLATSAPAQEGGEGEIQVGSLVAGDDARITYSNPDMAGALVLVEIYSGEESEYILIELDEDGEGESIWSVPEEWDYALFNAPDSEDVGRWIEENPLN